MKSSLHRAELRKWIGTGFSSLVFLISIHSSFGQVPDTIITINKDSASYDLRKIPAAFVPANFNVELNYNEKTLLQQPSKRARIMPGDVSKKLLARFKVTNPGSNPDSLYFFPDFSFRNVILYKIENNKAVPLPVIGPFIRDSISFRIFGVLPHDTITLLAECYPLKTYTNAFWPSLVRKNHMESFEVKLQVERKYVTLFTYVFCGLLLMMILFSIANFLQGGNKEFLYYAGYAFFLGLMFFTKQFYFNRSNATAFFLESYLDFVLQAIGICFFLAFMIRFLETRKNFPFLDKLYKGGIIFLSLVLALYTYVHYSSIDYYWENLIENVIAKNVLVGLIVVFLVYAVKNWHHKLLRY
ncbi:MAG TPA: 7TM-DISM domain-containing protein, partial [Chitinophagaceae bacterium]|nr:7TM-DISM domain-containing protein [Chitinophagaceae bacterium]